MKQGSTLFLKGVIFLIGILVLALGIFCLPWLANNPVNSDYAYILYPILIGIYLSTVPFFVALYQALRLLSYIDKNKAFSELSVRALKNIKYCAISISILYGVMMPLVYLLAEKDDAPGLIIMGMVPVGASLVVSVFAAVIQRLLQDAINIKSENDLTI